MTISMSISEFMSGDFLRIELLPINWQLLALIISLPVGLWIVLDLLPMILLSTL